MAATIALERYILDGIAAGIEGKNVGTKDAAMSQEKNYMMDYIKNLPNKIVTDPILDLSAYITQRLNSKSEIGTKEPLDPWSEATSKDLIGLTPTKDKAKPRRAIERLERSNKASTGKVLVCREPSFKRISKLSYVEVSNIISPSLFKDRCTVKPV